LEILLHDFPAGSWPGTADSVASLDYRGNDVLHLHFVVMRADSIHDCRVFTKFLGELGTKQCMA
jgi:hypothetical protein